MTAGRSYHLDADGVRVHAVEWVPTRGTTAASRSRRVLLVHGLGAHTLSWEPVGQPLADRLDATVTAIDLVGFGRTRAPRRVATLDTNRALVTAVLEELGPSVVAGNSMGGAIGIGLTARRPELVEGLVLVNPAVPHPSPSAGDWLRIARMAPVMVPPIGRRFVGTRARLLGPDRLVDASLAYSLHDPSRLDPGLRRRMVALTAERFAYPEAPAAYADAARSLFLYLARGINADLAAAAGHRPTLLLHGELDRLVPLAAAQGAAARHADIDLEVLHGIGHAPQLEDPDRVVDVVAGWSDARMKGWQDSSSSRSAASSPS
jgi:pimeloyl-ACP methyl ester carboxylesterase